MDSGVFNQVGEDLLNENGVHGDHQQLIRDIYRELDVRQALMGFLNGFGQDFLRGLRPGGQLRLVTADAGDGQQVFHHADQPLGLLLDVLKQGAAVLKGEVGVIQHGGGGADDGGEGGADIVGNGAQQIGAHPDLFVFHAQLIQLAGLGGEGGGDDGDAEKGEKGQGIAGDGEVEGPEGVCKKVVDGNDTQHCG